MTVDDARLDDDGPHDSSLARYQDDDPSFVDGKLNQRWLGGVMVRTLDL